MFPFVKPEHPVWAVTTIFQILNVSVPNQMLRFLLACFQRVVFFREEAPPLLEEAGTTNEPISFRSLCELLPTPLCEVYVICEKSKLGLSEIIFVST
jgi:hypothetical protein